jgi:glycosyltransferase involved in cell wall biosynthesis
MKPSRHDMGHPPPDRGKPLLAIVGGPDLAARVPLLRQLAARFCVHALGSSATAVASIRAAGFAADEYPLSRRVAPLGDLRALRALRAAFARLRPDVVHSFDTKPGILASLAARRARVPAVVTTITGLGSLFASEDLGTRALRCIWTALQRAASRAAAVTVFQNHDDLEQMVAAGVVSRARTAVVLGSGVDTDTFSAARAGPDARRAVRSELGLPMDADVVAMIARVTRSKGVAEFAAAARIARTTHPRAHFLLVGPEDPDSRLRLTADEVAALRRDLVWPGRRDDVARVLAAADLFVLPTAYREGIPRVLLEAAAMGLPLVATDSPGCNEVVIDGVDGLLVPVGDLGALAAAIGHLLADPELRARMGAAARRRAVATFDLRLIANQYEAIYRDLLVRRPCQTATVGSSPFWNSTSR